MKEVYVQDVAHVAPGAIMTLQGWCQSKRKHKNIVFIDLCDSTGSVQIVVSESVVSSEEFSAAKYMNVESALEVEGSVVAKNGSKEVHCQRLRVINEATRRINPAPRANFDIFNGSYVNQALKNRHLYIRNPKVVAMLKFRELLKRHMRLWFESNGFTEIDAPLLTPIPLYEDGSAVQVNLKGDTIFLTQCVGYYLEAAVHGFEKVYNMGPSFRGEESRSKRHLMEYWHIKAEVAFASREDIMQMVESIMRYLTERLADEGREYVEVIGTSLCIDGLQTPFPRITYADAVEYLNSKGHSFEYGTNMGSAEEELLAEYFNSLFWITDPPRSTEPFPYVIHPDDDSLTVVADLIASNGYGELLGTAEKIWQPDMLTERMREKGKLDDFRYDWVKEVHDYGCVPHAAFGMGLERLIRWLLNVAHVRDAIPFPRIFRRKITI